MSDSVDEFLNRQLPTEAPEQIRSLQRDALAKLTKSEVNERVSSATLRLVLQWAFVGMYTAAGFSAIVLWVLGVSGKIVIAAEYVRWVNSAAVGSGFIGGSKFVLDQLRFGRR